CEYLYATFSLKAGVGEGLSDDQAAAVGRWRTILHDIAVDEMLHLALVANVTAAIGAAPPGGRPNFPPRAGCFARPRPLARRAVRPPWVRGGRSHPLPVPRPPGRHGGGGRRRLRAEGARSRAAGSRGAASATAGLRHRRPPLPRHRQRAVASRRPVRGGRGLRR